MAILNIVKDGDEILRSKCREVDEITPRILRLLDDMRDTLIDSKGVGLAAPQVGVRRRIVLVENEKGQIYELINPKIVAFTQERQQDLEGCLSVPNKWGITDRPMSVTVEAMNRKGEIFQVSGSGLTARCFCHELDHLDGVLFYDKAVKMLTQKELEELSSND
ncbi:MAG: peptide deformylase [Clostridia bacterium]|jgi:peptide deformylase|nr:peptide deformylase [Clostridia bacterium]